MSRASGAGASSFADVWDAMDKLRQIAADKTYDDIDIQLDSCYWYPILSRAMNFQRTISVIS